MKKIIGLFTMMIFLVFILYSCHKEPLITEEYTSMQVYAEEQIVYETENKREIENIIEEINTASRETTYAITLPEEATREIIFKNDNGNLTVHLYDGGDITIDEYYVYTNFEF